MIKYYSFYSKALETKCPQCHVAYVKSWNDGKIILHQLASLVLAYFV